VLENPDPATLFYKGTYDFKTVAAAVNFVRAGIYDETLSILGWDDLGMRHVTQDYPVKHIQELTETKPHFAAYVNHSFVRLLENQTCFHARQKRAQNVEVFKSEQASALGRRS
jgi:hypothetical protein